MFRAKYAFLHDAVIQSYGREKSLLRHAKVSRQELLNLKLELEGVETAKMDVGKDIRSFEDEREKVHGAPGAPRGRGPHRAHPRQMPSWRGCTARTAG